MQQELEKYTGVTTLVSSQLNALECKGKIAPLQAVETAYIQFSSGSTSEPKGIVVSQQSLSKNIRGILRECIRIKPTDRAFSWLPLYHDMGMVGFALAPLFAQTSVDYISPMTFARKPTLWLQLMARNASTITYAPSFGYELAAKRFAQRSFPMDLFQLRLAGIGGDMIRPKVLEQFTQTLSSSGFNPAAFTPSYGMAEATLLVSFAHGLETDCIDSNRLETEQIAVPSLNGAHDKSLVVCGKPLLDHELLVVDQFNAPLKDRQVGHIILRGLSIASHYLTADGIMVLNNERSYLSTGDMGYMLDGKVVLTGRHKELILLNGRNIWPQDIEAAITQHSSLSVKRAAAFSLENNDVTQIIILVEYHNVDQGTNETVKTKIAAKIFATLGISVHVHLIPPGSLPYTSSGKLARTMAKELFLTGMIIARHS